jgi:uncharacterized protein
MAHTVLRSLRWQALLPLGLILAAMPGHTVTIEQIPSPRPGWTVDLTGSLTPETIQALNRLGDEVKQRTRGEMAVVVVGTIDGADPRGFATRLANAWGIGDRELDNGLLLFAALDDRAAEIVLGTGIDRPETREACAEIMQEEMVPRFRAGDPSGALLHGASAAARRIFQVASANEPHAGSAAEAVQPQAPAPAMPLTVRSEGPPAARLGLWLLPLLVVAALGGLIFLKVVPPRCRECRTRMVKLSEAGDDLHLEPAEQLEEKIGSVNYDLWLCNGCGQIVKRRWPNPFSGYGSCPHCRARTKSTLSTVLRHADESTEGRVQVTESCVNCDYRSTYIRTTPRHTRSNPSSSSGFSSRSSSSSGGSSSSGFGGGKSSGGGSSGRW